MILEYLIIIGLMVLNIFVVWHTSVYWNFGVGLTIWAILMHVVNMIWGNMPQNAVNVFRVVLVLGVLSLPWVGETERQMEMNICACLLAVTVWKVKVKVK